MKKTHLHFIALLVIAATGSLSGAEVTTFTERLEDTIVSAFVPPTRSEDPYAATAKAVFQWDNESQTWSQVYSPPWATARVSHIAGYAKSSQVLYVVHSGGVGRTGDSGQTWIEAVPPGFDGNAEYSLKVNPEEREQAVLASSSAVWQTFDYGESWSPMDLSNSKGALISLGFLMPDKDQPRFLLAQEKSLTILEGMPLRAVAKWSFIQSLKSCVVHPDGALAFLQMEGGNWSALSLSSTVDKGLQPLSGKADAANLLAVDSGSTSIWGVVGETIRIQSLADEKAAPFTVARLTQPPSSLMRHPRDQNALYAVTGRQIALIDDVFKGASSTFIAPVLWDSATPVKWQSMLEAVEQPAREMASMKEEPMDVAILISKLLANEPTFRETTRMALENEQFSPGSFLEWQVKARKRNWIPQMRLEGGLREYPTDDSIIVTSLDRFGIEQKEDYNLPDRAQTFSYFRLIFEWQLDQILYDEEMIDVSRERRQAFKDRRAMIDDLSHLYYQRLQRIIEAKGYLGKPSKARQMILLLEIHQLTEVLNGYCGEDLFDPFPLD